MLAPVIQFRIDQKLYCLTGPAHLGVLALAKRLRDVKAETGGPRLVDAEVGDLRSGGQKSADVEARSLRLGS